MMQTLPMQIKPFPPNRIIVSARFLKPIKEPCTIFVVANGDILNSAVRLLVHQRILGQFDKILEMITEKMGLRVLGGVRSLFTYEGQQVTEGNQLESGQLYVAVGRERFKKLPYSDLLFTKPRGTRRVRGMKSYSLPPIYRFSKQSENGKSMVQSSDSGDGESPKASPPSHNKERLSSIVREISQARLLSLKKRKSGQSLTPGDNDELEQKFDEGNADCQTLQDNGAEAKLDATDTNETEENVEKPEEKEEVATENGREEGDLPSNENKMNNQETNGEKEGEGGGKTEIDGQKDGKGEDIAENEKKVEEVKEEEKEDPEKNKEVFNGEEHGSSSDKALDSKEIEDGSNTSSQGERGKIVEDEKEDKDHSEVEKSTNDVDTVEEQKKTGNGNDPETTQSDNETKENDSSRSSRGNSNQEEDETKEGTTKESGEEEESKVNAEVSGEDNEVEGEAELNTDEKK